MKSDTGEFLPRTVRT